MNRTDEWVSIDDSLPKDGEQLQVKGKFPFATRCIFRWNNGDFFFEGEITKYRKKKCKIENVWQWKSLEKNQTPAEKQEVHCDFINKTNALFEQEANLNEEKRQAHIKKQRKEYFASEKGIFARSKGDFVRRSRMKRACQDLEWDEKILIGKFYKNCPKGYEVDHIIPISKGGLHKLSNLQYLTFKENRSKKDKILTI